MVSPSILYININNVVKQIFNYPFPQIITLAVVLAVTLTAALEDDKQKSKRGISVYGIGHSAPLVSHASYVAPAPLIHHASPVIHHSAPLVHSSSYTHVSHQPLIAHAPAVSLHHPVYSHEPLISHAPLVSHAPLISHAPYISHAPLVSHASYYHSSPLISSFHRRR